ncbi:MAG: hypothetical protein N3E46_01515 [Gemmataceae bacterium]|nr:hypothetical protein [Gemmataceae bacterium]
MIPSAAPLAQLASNFPLPDLQQPRQGLIPPIRRQQETAIFLAMEALGGGPAARVICPLPGKGKRR